MDLNKDIKDIHLSVNSTTFNILYRKYKSFVLPMGIIIACLVLFFIIVMPQIQSVISVRDQEQAEKIKLEKLKNNYNLLNNLDEATLNSELTTLSSTLPSNKDFAGIISTISDKSLQAGVAIGDFSFSVGDVTNPTPNVTLFPSLQIILSITGSPQAVIDFIKLLYKSTPMAEVTNISASGNSATITIQFFYKSFPQGAISDETQIFPFSQKDQALITDISSWSSGSSDSLIPVVTNPDQTASSSAENSGGFSPF